MNTKQITSFRDEYRFLSNFWYAKTTFDEVVYNTSEHAYQAAKSLSKEARDSIARCETPGQAKRSGSHINLRPDWDEVKYSIMEELLYSKFSNPELMRKLQSTSDYELIEGNDWHDVYWGVCFCETHQGNGENNLGKLLMQVRDENR